MWSSSRVLRSCAVVLALGLGPVLAGCTGFTPVYGGHGIGNARPHVRYAVPSNRLEQIIYKDLGLKLGKSDGPDAATVSISATAAARALTSQTVTNPRYSYQSVVTAVINVTAADGHVLFQGVRTMSADFTYDGQAFANTQAATEAGERAAKALADTIRLQILASLPRQ
jgi:LPS-assembly lipoprotein